MDIKQVLSDKNFVVVLDTNVLLNVYRYSPEFSEFALNCLKEIKDYVRLPATVYLEYSKHYKAEFAKMQKRVKNAGNETSDQIKRDKWGRGDVHFLSTFFCIPSPVHIVTLGYSPQLS